MDEQFISEGELAKRWGVTSRALRKRRAKGNDMPQAYEGRRGGFGQGVKYKLSDVVAFEESQKVPK